MKEPISIMEILAIVIKRGRAILCMALIGAVLGGAYQYSQGIKASRSPEYSTEVIEQNYTQAMEVYEVQKQQLVKELGSYQKWRTNLEQYLSTSILMNVLQQETPTSIVTLSIDEIAISAFDGATQNIDEVEAYYFQKIATAYSQFWQQMDLSTSLMNHPYVGLDESFLREIIDLTYVSNGIFHLKTYGLTIEDAHNLCNVTLDLLVEVQKTVGNATNGHSLKVISWVDKNTDNGRGASIQQEKMAEMSMVDENINRLTAEINALQEPQRASGYDFSSMYKKTVIFAVVGAVLFACLVCGWALVMYIVSDGVESSGQMAAIIGAPFLANTAGKQSVFVRWANALIGERYWADSASAAMYAVACLQKDVPAGGEIALVSTIAVSEEDEGIKSFAEELRASGYQVTVVNNATIDPAAVRLIRECGNVVMAERVGKSNRNQLVCLNNVIKQLDGKLLGFILV